MMVAVFSSLQMLRIISTQFSVACIDFFILQGFISTAALAETLESDFTKFVEKKISTEVTIPAGLRVINEFLFAFRDDFHFNRTMMPQFFAEILPENWVTIEKFAPIVNMLESLMCLEWLLSIENLNPLKI